VLGGAGQLIAGEDRERRYDQAAADERRHNEQAMDHAGCIGRVSD
jgi:hypothetical protein